jgi:hypothetical protein
MQGGCAIMDTEKVALHENRAGDSSDNDDYLWKCGTSDSNLHDDLHILAGNCQTIFGQAGNANWGDCVSSIRVWLPAGRVICFYEDSGLQHYRGSRGPGPKSGTRYDVNNIGGVLPYDWLSSFTFANSGNCPNA